MFGKESLARAQAFREWFRRYTSSKLPDGTTEYSKDLLQLPDAGQIQHVIELVNSGDYSTPDSRKEIVAAYGLLLQKAGEYADTKQSQMDSNQSGSFTQKYYREFLDEHSVLLEDEQGYWSNKFDTKKEDIRGRKKSWKENNTLRLQEAIAAAA